MILYLLLTPPTHLICSTRVSDSSANSGGSVVSLEETLRESSDEPAVSDETTRPTRRAAGRFKKLSRGLINSGTV